jgi:hypothetical protein
MTSPQIFSEKTMNTGTLNLSSANKPVIEWTPSNTSTLNSAMACVYESMYRYCMFIHMFFHQAKNIESNHILNKDNI